MKSTRAVIVTVGMITLASSALAHELFIKLDSYFLDVGAEVRVPILKGTFGTSEGSVAADRVSDLTLSSIHGVESIPLTRWSTDETTSYVDVTFGTPATYSLGISTASRLIELDAESFNGYLAGEGIPDVLAHRRSTGTDTEDAVERYSKHVKAIAQVGGERTAGWDHVFGYPAEIVPLSNPYEAMPGDEIAFRCTVHGDPIEGVLVIAGGEGIGAEIARQQARSDAHGVVRFVAGEPGKWFVKFIHMVETEEEGVDYESNWATLTFAVGYGSSQ